MTTGNLCRSTAIASLFTIAFLSVGVRSSEPAPATSPTPSLINWVNDYAFPEALQFCGEDVPVGQSDVRERIEVQVHVYSRNVGLVEIWFRRKSRYFMMFERILREMGLPDDLKYASVIESALQRRALSSAGAVGPWQFIESTGKEYGMRIDEYVDERLNVEIATRAALSFLKDLHSEFGSWPLALAAYNIGESRILRECYKQGTSSYYEMLLPNETDRYVMNIIAAKLIMERPEQFGIRTEHLTPFVEPESVSRPVEIRRSTPLSVIAWCTGLSYREFTLLNPWFVNDHLKAGTYTMRLPVPGQKDFETKLDRYLSDTRDTVELKKSARFRVTVDAGEMRIGPGTAYPLIRTVPKGETFGVEGHTSEKDRGNYWYFFRKDKDFTGWIWGGQVEKMSTEKSK